MEESEGVGNMDDGNVSTKEKGGRAPNNTTRYMYQIPVVYATFLKELVGRAPDLKRMEAWGIMVDALGLSNIQIS